MSKAEQLANRHAFAAKYMKDRYGTDKYINTTTQQSILYSHEDATVLVLSTGKTNKDGWQGLKASNFDDLHANDVILYHHSETNTTVEIYKEEIQQFLDNQFLVWKSDKDGSRTITRLQLRIQEIDNKNYLVITSSNNNKLLFKTDLLANRKLKAGTKSMGENLLLASFVFDEPKSKRKSK